MEREGGGGREREQVEKEDRKNERVKEDLKKEGGVLMQSSSCVCVRALVCVHVCACYELVISALLQKVKALMSNDLTLLSLPLLSVYPVVIFTAMSSHIIRREEGSSSTRLNVLVFSFSLSHSQMPS